MDMLDTATTEQGKGVRGRASPERLGSVVYGDREERSWKASPIQSMLRNLGCLIPTDSEGNGEGACSTCVEWDSQSRDSHLHYPAMTFDCITLRTTCSVWALQLSAEINW